MPADATSTSQRRNLARRIGTSQPAIARLEAGLADPKLSTIGFELHFKWQRVREPVANSRESVTA